MISISQKADELFLELLEPIMVALQADRLLNGNLIYTQEELLQRAVALQLYAFMRGKRFDVDLNTKLVTLK